MTSPIKATRNRPTGRRAFTLVEILMVLVILSIATVVSMPYLVKSIRGNRLRVAGATVVKAGRYAHTMALLNTREMKLVFNLDSASVRVEPRYENAPTPAPENPAPPPRPADDPTAPEPPPVTASPRLQIARTLDAVRLASVELEHRDRETAGEVAVIYRSNGRCTPYEVRIVDEFDNAMIINVDAIASASARREEH
jgi:prepilin-type N-terminal cleavage/methylation domain-containing protein